MTRGTLLLNARYGIRGHTIFIIGLASISAFLLYIWKDEIAALGITHPVMWTIWGCFFLVLQLLAATVFLLRRLGYRKAQRPYLPQSVHPSTEKKTDEQV